MINQILLNCYIFDNVGNVYLRSEERLIDLPAQFVPAKSPSGGLITVNTKIIYEFGPSNETAYLVETIQEIAALINSNSVLTGTDMVFVFGDSIPFGRSVPEVPGPTPVFGTVQQWYINQVLNVGDEDLQGVFGGSWWPQFGRDYVTNNPTRYIVINDVAAPGSTLTTVDPSDNWSESDSNWINAKTRSLAALSGIPNVRVIGCVIGVGVNDSRNPVKPTAEEFKTAYAELIDRITTEILSGDDTIPFYLQTVATSGNSGNPIGTESQLSAEMRLKVMELVEERSNVHLAVNTLGFPSQGLISTDDVHFIQDGNNKAGEKLARYIQKYAQYSNKEIARVLATFDTPLSSAHEAAWVTFIQNSISKSNWDAVDQLNIFVGSTENNTKEGLMGQGIRGIDSPTFNINSDVATDGLTNEIRTGYKSAWNDRYSLVDDILIGVKIDTNSTDAATLACLFGANATNGLYVQQNATGIQYSVHDNTVTLWNGETKFADNTYYEIGRSAGTKFLRKNGIQVHSASVAVVGQTSREVSLGARANGSSAFDRRLAGRFKVFYAGKYSAFGDLPGWYTDLNTLLAALMS